MYCWWMAKKDLKIFNKAQSDWHQNDQPCRDRKITHDHHSAARPIAKEYPKREQQVDQQIKSMKEPLKEKGIETLRE